MLEGGIILREIPDERGVVLWATYRDALLWNSTGGSRSNLFSSAALTRRFQQIETAAINGNISAVLRTLTILTLGPPAGSAGPVEIADHCGRIAEWAETAGFRRTGVHFAQAAAASIPDSATAALRVGQMATRSLLPELASSWFNRAVALGRRTGDSESITSALLELGRLSLTRGEVGQAESWFAFAARVARRAGHRTMRGEAAQGLLEVAAASRHYALAFQHARRALRLLGASHPLRPAVLHRLAEVILQKAEVLSNPDRSDAGLRAFRMVSSILPRPDGVENVRSYFVLLRAALTAKLQPELEVAWFAAIAAIGDLGETRVAARLYMELAVIGAEIIDRRRADDALVRAQLVGARIGDTALLAELETLQLRPLVRTPEASSR